MELHHIAQPTTAVKHLFIRRSLVQVYNAHDIPFYVIFDNDEGVKADDRAYNHVMCRLLGLPETDAPPAEVTASHAILGGNWETQMRADLEKVRPFFYDHLVTAAREALGLPADKGKPLVARYVAERLIEENVIPEFVNEITLRLKQRLGPTPSASSTSTKPEEPPSPPDQSTPFDDDVPF